MNYEKITQRISFSIDEFVDRLKSTGQNAYNNKLFKARVVLSQIYFRQGRYREAKTLALKAIRTKQHVLYSPKQETDNLFGNTCNFESYLRRAQIIANSKLCNPSSSISDLQKVYSERDFEKNKAYAINLVEEAFRKVRK